MKELLIEIAKRGWTLRIEPMHNGWGLLCRFRGKDRGPKTYIQQVAISIEDLVNDEMGLVEHQLQSAMRVLQEVEDGAAPSGIDGNPPNDSPGRRHTYVPRTEWPNDPAWDLYNKCRR